MGLSIAYQLARRGLTRVIVLDKGAGVAEGSTGGSSGICRQRYSHPNLIRLADHGRAVYDNWAAFTGLDRPDNRFQRIGVLWMTNDSPEAVASRDRLIAAGTDAVILTAAQVAAAYPALSTCGEPFDLTGSNPHECRPQEAFLFEPSAGFADPPSAAQDLVTANRRRGVEVRFNTKVETVRSSGGRIRGVGLADGSRIDGGLVVNAAGPWCNRLTATTGLELPWDLRPTRVQVLYRTLPPEVPGPLPVTIDGSTGVYFRPDTGGASILMGSVLEQDEQETVADPDHYSREADRSFIEAKIHAIHHRIPSLPHRGRVSGMASLYTINEQDVHPIVGPTRLSGYFVANGFSGHGFKLAPAIGAMVAAIITGDRSDYDVDVPLDFFSVDRAPLAIDQHNVLA